MDANNVAVLLLLDLSAAFDTVDHKILIDRLEKWAGLSDSVLAWFQSYLTGRQIFVSLGAYVSETHVLNVVFLKEAFSAQFCFHYICSHLETLLTITMSITILC